MGGRGRAVNGRGKGAAPPCIKSGRACRDERPARAGLARVHRGPENVDLTKGNSGARPGDTKGDKPVFSVTGGEECGLFCGVGAPKTGIRVRKTSLHSPDDVLIINAYPAHNKGNSTGK